MEKYAHMKMFHHDHRIQVYMYSSMYVNPKKISKEEYFPATIFQDYKKVKLSYHK